MTKIVPGILTADEQEYANRLRLAEHVTDLIQIDIIDGKFAENITVGTDIIKKYPSSSQLEIQLMVISPRNYIEELGSLEYVSRIIFPIEIEEDINEQIYQIKKMDKQVGISLNPDTPIETAHDFLDAIDLLLLMTGRPGFSGQKLGEGTYGRVRQVKILNPNLPVEIDIGVNFENAPKLARAGADFLVTTSAIYNAPDFRIAYEKLDKLVNK